MSGSIVGIDVGGTKTHVAGRYGDGTEFDLVVPSQEWRGVDLFPTVENMARLARLLVDRLCITDVTAAAGVHGCDTPELVAAAREGLASVLGPRVVVVNDADLLGPTSGIRRCLRVIVGTGAIALGDTAEGERVVVDGHGWVLGDAGSAAALVRDALRALLYAWDRSGDDTDPLVRAMCGAFAASGPGELAYLATLEAAPEPWGRHAPAVFSSAVEGSRIARAVIESAAQRLADNVRTLVMRGAVADAVVAGGGVIVNQPALQDALRQALVDVGIDLPLVVLDRAPVSGAVVLAEELAGSTPGA